MQAERSGLLLWSHMISAEQTADLKQNWGVELIVELPVHLRAIWSQVPVAKINWLEYADPICSWLQSKSKKGAVVVVQGEYGLTHYMVQWCTQNDLIPVYALTMRSSVEEQQASGAVVKTSKFVHSGFREYPKLNFL